MERLERIISPDMGVFTNLGTAHQENFESLEEKLQEKLSLIQALQQNHIQGGSGKGELLSPGPYLEELTAPGRSPGAWMERASTAM